MEKTQGMMVGSSCTDNRLPSINWQNQSIKILGFKIGNVNDLARQSGGFKKAETAY